MSELPRWLPEVEVEFEYDLPDKFCHQTNDLGKKGTFTYKGPEKIYVFVNKETNLLEVGMDCIAYDAEDTDQLNQVTLKAGAGHEAVLISAKEQPLLATLVWMDTGEESAYPCKTWKIDGDDTVYFWKSEPLIPNEAYAQDEITYDFDKKQFNRPFPWEKPTMTEELFEETRLNLIWHCEQELANEEKINDPANAEARQKVVDHVNELKNLRIKFPAPEWDPWMIKFPDNPRGDILEGNPFDRDEQNDPERSFD